MSDHFDKYQKRRLLSSYFSVVLSMYLVLFLLGALAFFVVNSNQISNNFKEEIAMSVYFKNNVSKERLEVFAELLKQKEFVKDITFVSKEEAAKKYAEENGEDFMTFLGFNPLQNSFDIHLNGDFIEGKIIATIDKSLRDNEIVNDVVYDKELIGLVNKNIERISFWILVISSFLVFIAVLLINSSLRLSIYAKRFIIKTMQLVGATKSFIRRPFIWQSIKLGIIGAVFANLSLFGLIFYLDHFLIPDMGLMDSSASIGAIMAGVLVFGVIITWLSTFFATQRFLNLRTGDLY